MKTGLSLPVSYLSGGRDKQSPYYSVFGEPESFLAKLKSIGAASVELRGANRSSSADSILLAARKVFAAGLETTAHSYLPPEGGGESFFGMYEELEPYIRELAGLKKETVITVHSYASADEELELLEEKTLKALLAIDESITSEKLPVKIALEINRRKGKNDPGDTYSGLSGIFEKASPANAGFCWDFGHAYSNVLKGALEKLPSAEFLKHVIHTHIHAVGPDGRTHWPLGKGRVPLADFTGALQTAGYSGVYNLELSLERFIGEANPAELVEESFRMLGESAGMKTA